MKEASQAADDKKVISKLGYIVLSIVWLEASKTCQIIYILTQRCNSALATLIRSNTLPRLHELSLG